jgi:hypothetical protein
LLVIRAAFNSRTVGHPVLALLLILLLPHPFGFPRASSARVTFLCLPKEK